ncbi:peptidoglycan DD-metalloendopeptidase family protein [Flavobacterium sp.]|uniref:peptidoglycan DD-metalloendopeptidase family protein n=1 Tax=Flavobacterium sp. TaxID=239 RepID=UPI00404788D5
MIDITPGYARKENVTCKINHQKGVSQSIEIVEAEILNAHFTDSNGIKIENASWEQTVYIYIDAKHLSGEEINIKVYDQDYFDGNDHVGSVNTKSYNGKPLEFKLDKTVKDKTGSNGKLYFKVSAPHLTLKNSDTRFPSEKLTVEDAINFENPIIGEENGLKKHYLVDYDDISWFYVNTTGIKDTTKLKIGVWQYNKEKELVHILALKHTLDKDGVLKAKIEWNKIQKIKTSRIVYIRVKDENDKILCDSVSKMNEAALTLQFTPTAVKMVENKAAMVVGTQALAPTDEHQCPNCNKPITPEELKSIFTEADDDTLKKVADTYSKYMQELGMNTCWNKAHFFAQAYVESGLKLHVSNGENFNYYYEGLSIFSAFTSVEGREKARLWGRPVRRPSQPGVTEENQRNIANWAYSYQFSKGKEIGNTLPDDGWNFRGKGLIQLTGRTAYTEANKYTIKEGADIIANPDLVITNISIAVLSSMAFFKWKRINTITNGNTNTRPISVKVGKEVGSSYTEKQNAFNEHTFKVFKINKCSYGKNEVSSVWVNPLANSQRTYYNSNGAHKEQNGAFGPVRLNSNGTPKNHQGLDLFAEVNTSCKACLDGEIVSYSNEGSDGYGNVLVLKVKGEDLRSAKRSYTHEFTSEVESGTGFDLNAEFIYLRYAHLSSAEKTSGNVKAGDVICKTGDSGNARGVPNPHLHFEIAKNASGNGRGLQNRYNPAYFVRLDQIDVALQTRIKNERS